jgi:Rrf2 family protein
MSSNSRLTIATHALVWMAAHERTGAAWTTSEQIARSVRTNAVVIRRLMSDLEKGGVVESRRGRGAGSRLARAPEKITLRQIDEALGVDTAFAMHRNEPSPTCPIAQGIRSALSPVYARVNDAVGIELQRTTLADLLHDILNV